MILNKTMLTLAICLTIYWPLQCKESIQETNRLSNQQETIISAIASAAAEGIIEAIKNALEATQTQHPISLEQAHNKLQKLMDNLDLGMTFEINDVKYVIQQAQKNLDIDNESVTKE
ncbi:MAG: hypothetical protein Q8Q60_03590 [Candidatus Chromulinivorax sp.]|nr:hypothetical protein [Candidatus Chromulinivorax sp.]